MSERTGQPTVSNEKKGYRDFGTWLRNEFGARVAKLPVDAGFTCPNRDGTRGTGGCVYCDGRGSRLRQAGALPGVTAQLHVAEAKYRSLGFEKFIPYFQTFTNTHAPLARLEALWDEALGFSPDVVGLAIGTRPDCVPEPVLDALAARCARGRVFLELGIQTAHPATLVRLNRCHSWEASVDAVHRAAARGLLVVAHLILGLPGETPAMMRETARALAALPVAAVKIHSLLVIEGTALAADWRRGAVPLPELPTYAGWVADVLERLPPHVAIQRLAADARREVLLAPAWARNKQAVIAAVERELARRGARQGR
ncbi:MAG TPA: TIGR01212 family radical SAM protein [Candidatus Methanoperedens sp.]|nr:TIGR01212 family radical SAM protein [Candidatus Methanoperedens sp.]